MAWQPCLRCDQRFSGEAQNAYLTIYDGEYREAYRFVVCSECLVELVTEWRNRALYRDSDGDWTYQEPSSDGAPRYTLSQPQERPQRRKQAPNGHPRKREPLGAAQSDKSTVDELP